MNGYLPLLQCKNLKFITQTEVILFPQSETPKQNTNKKISTRKLQTSYFSLKTRIEWKSCKSQSKTQIQ